MQNLVPAGPWLQYLGQREGKWLGSALIVLPPTQMNMEEEPVLHYSAGGKFSVALYERSQTTVINILGLHITSLSMSLAFLSLGVAP